MTPPGARVLCSQSGSVVLTGLGAIMTPLASLSGFGAVDSRPRYVPGREIVVAWSMALASRALIGTCQLFGLIAVGGVEPVQRNRSATGHGLWPFMAAAVEAESGVVVTPNLPAGSLALRVDVSGGPGAGDVLSWRLAAWDWPTPASDWSPL